ncbi:hypothetical protein [Agaribacterium haliotis]|uniref:hypothetical protein n=1 Tax=Agaribacterium haliotis TaxID=2013869 RepID=UPI00117854D7|nr:hypothetical protein [Agaribacterium haliotis]
MRSLVFVGLILLSGIASATIYTSMYAYGTISSIEAHDDGSVGVIINTSNGGGSVGTCGSSNVWILQSGVKNEDKFFTMLFAAAESGEKIYLRGRSCLSSTFWTSGTQANVIATVRM